MNNSQKRLIHMKERIGYIASNMRGCVATIVDYRSRDDITVEFKDGYQKIMSYREFSKGEFTYPYERKFFGVGYLGEGKHTATVNWEATTVYRRWITMLRRCYDEEGRQKQPAYNNCTVCKEWHNFQNYADFFEANYYELDSGEPIELDKDVLSKNNKLYSPSTCLFLPKKLNLQVTNHDNLSGLPRGVTETTLSKRNPYIARIYANGRTSHIGSFPTPKLAFLAYKEKKEETIKKMADLYKDKIPREAYEALYSYEILDVHN